KAWLSLDGLAAWAGWDDPRIKPLAEQLEALEAKWAAKATAYLAKQVASLPAPAKARARAKTFEAWDPQVSCTAPDAATAMRPCDVVLQANTSKPQSHAGASVIDAHGFETDLDSATIGGGSDDQAPDQQAKGQPDWVRVSLKFPSPPVNLGRHPGRAPYNVGGPIQLIRLCPQQRSCLLRLQ